MDVLCTSTYQRYGVNAQPLINRNPGRFGMFIFTQASARKNPDYAAAYGDQLMRAIRRLKLGRVTASRPFRNPNSGNYVRTYNWIVDWKASMKFLHKELKKANALDRA